MHKPPKDLEKYIPSHVAAARLITLAVDYILCRSRARIKWTLKIHFYYPPEALAAHEGPCIATYATFGSGDWEEPVEQPEAPKGE